MFHQRHELFTYEPLLNKMVAARAVLCRQYAGLRCAVSVSLVLQLCKASVPPVLLYGCEVRGQLTIPAAMKGET